MKQVEKRRSKTIAAKSPAEFDKLYNSTADELAEFEPEVEEYMWGEMRCAEFKYTETKKIREDLADDFMQHDVECKCKDCPFLEIGTDARRRWFPCQYATYGETRMDSPACDMFYKEAKKRMREGCK